MVRNKLRAARALVAGVAVAATFVLVPSAQAATGTGSITATCDPANYNLTTDNVSWSHNADGTVKIQQTDSSPTITSTVTAKSQNGNFLTPYATLSDGQVGTWTSVIHGTYKVYAEASSTSVDCNGGGIFGGGLGNYEFDYKITY